MAVAPPRQVTSGYFRNHLYVMLGLERLGRRWWPGPRPSWHPCAGSPWPPPRSATSAPCVAVRKAARRESLALAFVAAASLAGAWLAMPAAGASVGAAPPRKLAVDNRNFGSERGPRSARSTHERPAAGRHDGRDAAGPLVSQLARHGARAAQAAGAAGGRGRAAASARVRQRPGAGTGRRVDSFSTGRWLFLALRWLFGLVGRACWRFMAWQTLKIPNTQSATGILYVAVIGVFVGELASLLLSAEALYPSIM